MTAIATYAAYAFMIALGHVRDFLRQFSRKPRTYDRKVCISFANNLLSLSSLSEGLCANRRRLGGFLHSTTVRPHSRLLGSSSDELSGF